MVDHNHEIVELKIKPELYKLFPKNAIGAELGVCQGDNAVMLHKLTQPSHLYLVDIWEKDEDTYKNCPPHLYYDDWFDLVKKKLPYNNVTLIKQDSIVWLESIPDNFLDWIYIDSLHDYNHVNKEYNLSIKKVKKGGIIAGHDFVCHPAWKTGVIRAVLNQVQNNNLLLTHMTSESQFISTMGINIKK